MKSALSANVLGCTCKTCECVKRYCICFANSLECDPNKCKCRSCKNTKSESNSRLDEIHRSDNLKTDQEHRAIAFPKSFTTQPTHEEVSIQLPSLVTSTDVINNSDEVLRETVDTLSRLGPILSTLDNDTLQRLGDNARRNVLTILSTIHPDLLKGHIIQNLRTLINTNDESSLKDFAIEELLKNNSSSSFDNIEDTMIFSSSPTSSEFQSDTISKSEAGNQNIIPRDKKLSSYSNLETTSQEVIRENEEASFISNPLNLMASVATKALQKKSESSVSLSLKMNKNQSEGATTDKSKTQLESLLHSNEKTASSNKDKRKRD